jgi:hypothetical protein
MYKTACMGYLVTGSALSCIDRLTQAGKVEKKRGRAISAYTFAIGDFRGWALLLVSVELLSHQRHWKLPWSGGILGCNYLKSDEVTGCLCDLEVF